MFKTIFKRVKNLFLYAYVMFFCALLPSMACAEGEFPIDIRTGADLGNKIKELVTNVGMPIGGAILFLAVVIVAVKLMLSGGKAQERAETMSGLMYVAIGGVLLGGALFFAGVILGIGSGVFK